MALPLLAMRRNAVLNRDDMTRWRLRRMACQKHLAKLLAQLHDDAFPDAIKSAFDIVYQKERSLARPLC